MKRQLLTGLVALSVVGVLGQSHAYAGALLNNFGLVDPAFTLTFDEIVFPEGTVITNEYADYGITFKPTDPGMVYDTQGPAPFPGIDGHYVGNFFPVNNPFSIVFTSVFSTPHTSAAFGMATNPGTTIFTALLGGLIVESFTALTTFDDPFAGYYGFVGILFDEIQIQIDSELALIDNIQMIPLTEMTPVPVPEPATILLVGSGLAFSAFRRRRRRAPPAL